MSSGDNTAIRGFRDIHAIDADSLLPKVYLNGFPKSGLHMADLMTHAIAKPAAQRNWLGNIGEHSWSTHIVKTPKQVNEVLDLLPAGYYLKGHMAYSAPIARRLERLGYAVAFVYRDLRDVAVSQAHHILSDDEDRLHHPGRDVYRRLGSMENILCAIIEGVDEYPGLFARWAQYTPWLLQPWVHHLRFEDMRNDTELAALRFVEYVSQHTAQHSGVTPVTGTPYQQRAAARAVAYMDKRELSATYRSGQTGGWREVFTDRVRETFKRYDRGGWLVRLGYEQSSDW